MKKISLILMIGIVLSLSGCKTSETHTLNQTNKEVHTIEEIREIVGNIYDQLTDLGYGSVSLESAHYLDFRDKGDFIQKEDIEDYDLLEVASEHNKCFYFILDEVYDVLEENDGFLEEQAFTIDDDEYYLYVNEGYLFLEFRRISDSRNGIKILRIAIEDDELIYDFFSLSDFEDMFSVIVENYDGKQYSVKSYSYTPYMNNGYLYSHKIFDEETLKSSTLSRRFTVREGEIVPIEVEYDEFDFINQKEFYAKQSISERSYRYGLLLDNARSVWVYTTQFKSLFEEGVYGDEMSQISYGLGHLEGYDYISSSIDYHGVSVDFYKNDEIWVGPNDIHRFEEGFYNDLSLSLYVDGILENQETFQATNGNLTFNTYTLEELQNIKQKAIDLRDSLGVTDTSFIFKDEVFVPSINYTFMIEELPEELQTVINDFLYEPQ